MPAAVEDRDLGRPDRVGEQRHPVVDLDVVVVERDAGPVRGVPHQARRCRLSDSSGFERHRAERDRDRIIDGIRAVRDQVAARVRGGRDVERVDLPRRRRAEAGIRGGADREGIRELVAPRDLPVGRVAELVVVLVAQRDGARQAIGQVGLDVDIARPAVAFEARPPTRAGSPGSRRSRRRRSPPSDPPRRTPRRRPRSCRSRCGTPRRRRR